MTITAKIRGFAICPECAATVTLRRDGLLPVHRWTIGAGRSGLCAGSSRDGSKPQAAWKVWRATEAVRVARWAVERAEWDCTSASAAGRALREFEREFESRSKALRAAEESLRLTVAASEAL